MRRSLEIAGVFLVAFLVLVPVQRDALTDDFEDDFWISFTHFHLGDRASAGYSTALAHSGLRAYRVEIHGWSVRDFGAAYGYAIFSTRGAPLGELRLSLLYDSLQDTVASPWDAYAAGISLELLDSRHATLGTYRYVTAYHASQNAGRCAPTLSDVLLDDQPMLNTWIDVGRNPAADFPSAPWRSAASVKVAVGFLCAAGLTGASYGLYFDDFALEADSGDVDGDGLRNLEEETRIHAVQLSEPEVPIILPPLREVNLSLIGPPVSGDLVSGVVAVDLVHPRPDDLSVSLVTRNGTREESYLLWDPGAFERGVAITSPAPGRSVRGDVRVTGRVSPAVADGWVRLLVNGVERPVEPLDASDVFSLEWPTDALAEGPVSLQVEATGPSVDWKTAALSAPLSVVVDRTPPDLQILSPGAGETVSGLLGVSVGAYDAQGVVSVELLLDGVRVETREQDPFVFLYETMDLTNADHVIEVRAADAAGNAASRSLTVSVSNKVSTPPPPCYPACNLTGGTSVGNLAPLRAEPRMWGLTVASGERLEVSEGLQVPWHPQVVRTANGVSLVLDALRDAQGSTSDGLVVSNLTAYDFARSGIWRLVVRDHGADVGGFIQRASVRFAARTSPDRADTDGDGLADGEERALPDMSPVLADLDGDGLSDGWESSAHTIAYAVDGEPHERVVRTDPLNPDTDSDGLPDGDEVDPPPEWNVTNPNEPDTDRDGLADGAERSTYGSDPTRTDTDADTLGDGFEVTPHPLSLVIDGAPADRSVVTSPVSRDTDGDGLGDAAEWGGADLVGFGTDPSDADTDHDGLSDGDEIRGTNRRPTNPLASDSDADGLLDGIDLAPTETWAFPWTSSFAPGLIRFTQRFHALDVHGAYAAIWTYNVEDDTCVFLSEHTAEATRSSDESASNVAGWINKTFLAGGETNYTALGMRYMGLEGSGLFTYERGACSVTAPRKYIIEYTNHNHLWDVDFVNVAPVRTTDEYGTSLDHATLEIPLVPDVSQTLLVQVSIRGDTDRGTRTPEGLVIVPAFQYSLHRSSDFLGSSPYYQSVALGARTDDHAYQFVLRIPKEVAKPGNAILRDGRLYAVLDVVPVWLRSASGNIEKTALNASTITVGAAITKVERLAERIVARLDVDLTDLNVALPGSIEGVADGLHAYGPYSVYVYRVGSAFEDAVAQSADAIWLSADTEQDIAEFQATIAWSSPDQWVRDGRDALGTNLAILKIIRRGVSLTSQLVARLVPTTAALPAWIGGELAFDRSYVTAVTIGGAVEWNPIYLVSASGTRTVNIQTFGPDIGYPTTDSFSMEWELGNAEILDDLDDSVILSGARNFNLRTGLQGAAIGATLVIFGSQAVLAYMEGDALRGTVYAFAGAVTVFGIVRSEVVLAPSLFEGSAIRSGVSLKVGMAATLAVGGILASYELFLAATSADAIQSLSHYEAVGATVLDTSLGVVPLYGPALSIGWQLGLGLAVGLQNQLGIVPNRLAAKLTSSPGSTIVFLFEYILGGEIPSAIAEDALGALLSALAESMRFCNNLNPPSPTILVAP